jgi:Zn-dependent protease
VFLLEPDRTQFDLSWRMFGVPVRVHPLFWLVALIFGWSDLHLGFQYVLAWVGIMFVSILLHELGHVFMARVFGYRSHVVLYSFGGLAVQDRPILSRWQHILVCFAGPLVTFALAGAAYAFALFALRDIDPDREMPLLAHTVGVTFGINLFWGVLNLLPVWPLDGGQISRDVFTGVAPRRGLSVSLGLSFLVAALLAVNSLMGHYDRTLIPYVPRLGIFGTIMFALLAIQSFQLMQMAMQEERRWDRPNDDGDEWDVRRDPWR